jgi:hypothetical protein
MSKESKPKSQTRSPYGPLPAPAVADLRRAVDDLEREQCEALGRFVVVFARSQENLREVLQTIVFGNQEGR